MVIVSVCTKSFQLNRQAFQKLQQNDVPEDTLRLLKPLENKKFRGESEFLEAVREKIGDKRLQQYKDHILKVAYIGNPNPNQKWQVQ